MHGLNLVVIKIPRVTCCTFPWVVLILLSSSAGVTTAGQSLAPRPPVAAPAPRAVPPYKYASSVRSPHPPVQPLQVTRGSVPEAAAGQQVLHAAEEFSQKQSAQHLFLHPPICLSSGTSACSTCAGTGTTNSLHAGCCPSPGAETDAGWVKLWLFQIAFYCGNVPRLH